jgi:hypothetical protein
MGLGKRMARSMNDEELILLLAYTAKKLVEARWELQLPMPDAAHFFVHFTKVVAGYRNSTSERQHLQELALWCRTHGCDTASVHIEETIRKLEP